MLCCLIFQKEKSSRKPSPMTEVGQLLTNRKHLQEVAVEEWAVEEWAVVVVVAAEVEEWEVAEEALEDHLG